MLLKNQEAGYAKHYELNPHSQLICIVITIISLVTYSEMKSDDIFPETEKTTIPLGNNWRCLACFTSATLSWLPGSLLTLHSQPSPQTVQRVEVGQVDELRITKDLEVIGSLEPFLEIEISSQAQGLIISMPVDEGKRVSKGDLLFELDALAEEIALRRAKAELEKSQTELRKLKAGYLPQEIEEARKRVNANEAINAAAEDGWKRIQRLEEQGIVSASELIKAQTDLEVTRSQVSQSSARLLLLEQGYRNEDIQIAAAEVKVQQALVAGIEKRIADTRIEAPAAGVIVTRLKDLAEWTNSGERVLVMVVDNEMKLRIEVPQKNVPSIKPGQKATVQVPGLEDHRFTAEVVNLVPKARLGSRNFPVILRLKNKDRRLASGMFAKVRLHLENDRMGLTVPRTAIQFRGEDLVVYRVDPLPAEAKQSGKTTFSSAQLPGAAGKNATVQDAVAVEVKVIVTEELDKEIVIQPIRSDELWKGCEVVIMGGTRLTNRSPLHRLRDAGFPPDKS